jgi:hypothetical protein
MAEESLMGIALSILIIVSLGGLATCFWGLHCNNKTLKQRLWLINNRPHHTAPEYDVFYREFDAVTYDEHLSALFWFKDPINLYGPLTQGIILGKNAIVIEHSA